MDTRQLPKSLRDRLNKPKQDYQGNHETFDMPEALKPDTPKSEIPFGKIGGAFVAIIVLVAVVLVILSILTDSQSFL